MILFVCPSFPLLPPKAMGRIFVGLCQVGAWGCFDEFNRLEERMLSAVSQQVQTIQEALKEQGLQNGNGVMERCHHQHYIVYLYQVLSGSRISIANLVCHD